MEKTKASKHQQSTEISNINANLMLIGALNEKIREYLSVTDPEIKEVYENMSQIYIKTISNSLLLYHNEVKGNPLLKQLESLRGVNREYEDRYDRELQRASTKDLKIQNYEKQVDQLKDQINFLTAQDRMQNQVKLKAKKKKPTKTSDKKPKKTKKKTTTAGGALGPITAKTLSLKQLKQ